MKKALLLTTIGVLIFVTLTKAQDVFNPNDLNRRWVNNGTTYSNDSTLLTANPNPAIAGLQKWVSVKTNGVDSNAWGKDYKAYFINLNGTQLSFRLKFPKSFLNPDSSNKKYPVMLFFHGAGEPGCPTNGGIYNNEKQLVHGGLTFRNRVENNQFDGFLLYPQVVVPTTGCWSDWGMAGFAPNYNAIIAILDSLAKYERLDVDRVFADGLSNGGVATWSFTAVYPQRVTKAAPSSAATVHTNYSDYVHVPIWFATGGKDTNPSPSYAQSSYDGFRNTGGDIRWTLYPDLGHSVWTTHWAEPDFVPFMNDMHKANPLVYFQRTDYCPDSVINARIGITAGFYAYEWQKDNVDIANRVNGVNTIVDGSSLNSFTGNEVVVKSFGTYRVRFKRTATSDWSAWSPKPAVIRAKTVTQTPPITVNGMFSKVLPALDGATSSPLMLPTGYAGYQWVRVSDNVVVGNTNTFVATTGQYKAKILETFGCGSNFSPIFTVVSASGNPKPDGAKNLSALQNSANSIQLDWNENPNAGENETGFEIYRSNNSGGPYQLIAITNPNVITYMDMGLTENSKYYYIVRAVGSFGAAAPSNEAFAQTTKDEVAPATPAGLAVVAASRTFVNLSWTAATDNIGVVAYDIYVNGVKSYTTSATNYTVNALTPRQTYAFTVKARDAGGNESQPSNQVTANTIAQGVAYKFYNNPSGLAELPDYNAMTPALMGSAANIALTAGGTDNFGYVWDAYIYIGTAGTYRFRSCSDDGSKIYFNQPYNDGATPIANNDGIHSNATCATSAGIALAAGTYYPISISYFDGTGSNSITVTWSLNSTTTFTAIPNSAFQEFTAYTPAGSAPVAPSAVSAVATSYDRIQLTWDDNSNNETGFEITRSTTLGGTYSPIATVNTNSYLDTALSSNTSYYYKVRAVGAFGQSAFTVAETIWNLNSNYNDAMGSTTRTLAGANGPTFNTSDKVRGSASLSFDGTNDFVNINNSTSNFPSDGGYNQRTISLWIKPTVTTGKRMIFDFGGPDNGMALRFNSNALEFGIASASTRATISLLNFATNANWVAGGWNNITVTYNTNAVRLYLNGVQVASNLALTISSIAASSTSPSALGSNATSNAFNDNAGYTVYSGLMDEITILTNEMASATEVTAIKNFTYGQSMDTTAVAPATPAAPTGLTAASQSQDAIQLTWNDNSGNEAYFEIWRSVGNTNNYRLIKKMDPNATATASFTDTALFANITYYYMVKAVGIGGGSNFTNVANATTLNTAPVLTNILDFTMKYGTSYALPVNAVDADGDALSFSFENLPSFATIETVSNGNINVVFTPTIGDQGVYTITAFVSDGQNGGDTTFFSMVINDNTVPTLAAITDKIVNEGASLVVPLNANDEEGNNYMAWFFADKPSFASFVDSGNGKGSITLAPGFAASGEYNMTAYVDDGSGAWTSRTFKITVNEVDPNESIRVNFKYFSNFTPGWNDVDLFASTAPFNQQKLITLKGDTSTVGIRALSTNYNGAGYGVETGNNSGVYPDNVLKSYIEWGLYSFGTDDTLRLRVYGLDTARRYNFTFMASSTNNCCGVNASSVTSYLIGNDIAQVHYYLNSTETDTIYQVKPNTAGEVVITMVGDAQSLRGGMLNALVIDAAYDDGTAPAKPLNISGNFIENSGVRLGWVDRSYNEFGYNVYRSTSRSGPYSLINPAGGNKDSVGYTDATAAQYTHYYYYVAGFNNRGLGASSDTIEVITENNKPVISGLVSLQVKTDATVQEDFTVTDVAGDDVVVSILNKPSFVTLTDLGSSNYRIVATPTIDNLGQHFLTVEARDNKGGITTKGFVLTVTDKNVRSVFVNFGVFGATAPEPWNNFLHYGNSGSLITDLNDEEGVNTNFSMSLGNGWNSMFTTGHMTGNHSGAVSDSVLQSGIFFDGTTARTITINGLDNTKRYNIVVISSQNEGYDAVMRLTTNVGAQSDTVNAKYNTNQTGNLNGLTPNLGSITVNMTKLTGSNFIFLNGMIIEEFAPALIATKPLNPVNLYAEPKDKTTVSLSWSDRSGNENSADGFQIQRATDSLFTTGTATINLGGNNTTYTNTGLSANTKYWYRVRSKAGTTFSDWSNAVKTITPETMVLVNFNQNVQSASNPWNNLAQFPASGVKYVNLQDNTGINSGLNLEITKQFNGENNAGMSTGNNTGMGGLVPDVVMQSAYWMDNEQKSQFVISGLNQAKRYRIGYISSINWIGGNLTATLTINGRTVYINSWQNTSKIVYIGNLIPDSNGQLVLDISTTAAAANAYSNGILIEAYDDLAGGAVLNAANKNQLVQNVAQEANDAQLVADEKRLMEISTYPNPFVDYINIDFNNTVADGRVSVDLYEISGRLVMSQQFGKMAEGAHTLRLNAADGKLSTGVYMVTLKVNGKAVAVSKLLKK